MKKYFKAVFIFIFIVSCSGKTKIPRDVVGPDKMEKVLWDVFMADAAGQQISAKDSTVVLSDKIKELTGESFRVNKIKEEDFFKSYNWYIKHPEIFNELLDSIYSHQSNERDVVSDHKPLSKTKSETTQEHVKKPDSADNKIKKQ